MDKFAIVIPCYNRLDTLKNLLDSLTKAFYEQEVSLVFSIDNSGSDIIVNFANDFNWKFGEKVIIHHKKNIGLRNNIISCGDLTKDYDAVIVLEDDLLVSQYFFVYAKAAYDYYKEDDHIAGISLFSYRVSENLHEFNPLTYGYDTFFMQWTASWGQMWNKKQWNSFREWYNKRDEGLSNVPIPDFVRTWTHSWKKYHIAYLVDTKHYFVYPTISYTTVQPALGEHVSEVRLNKDNIVPLCNGIRRNFVFQSFNSTFLYDCFFELKSLTVILDGKDIQADLNIYGHKGEKNIKQAFFITSKKINNAPILKSWGINTVPYENNIINSEEGEDLFLYSTEYFEKINLTPSEKVAFRIKLTNKEKLLYYSKRMIELIRK